jgi:tRNA threonylcarbamoyladenosine biosynthesis protein TsaB
MKVLGIETSGDFCGVAVLTDGGPPATAVSEVAGTHVERGVLMIRDLLEAASLGIAELDGVGVSLGPGSFTGLRIGLATAKGLCLGAGLSMAGVPTLDCMAEALCPWEGYIVPVRDARRGEIYLASYRASGGRVERISGYRALVPEDVVAEIADLAAGGCTLVAGDALSRYGEMMRASVPAGVVFATEDRWRPDPAVVASIATRNLRKGETLDLAGSEPLYVRPSEAERARRRRPDGRAR